MNKQTAKSLTPSHQAMIDNAKKSKKMSRTTEEIEKDYQKFYQLRMAEIITNIHDKIKSNIKDSNKKFFEGLVLGVILSIFGSILATSFLKFLVAINPPGYEYSTLAWGSTIIISAIALIWITKYIWNSLKLEE